MGRTPFDVMHIRWTGNGLLIRIRIVCSAYSASDAVVRTQNLGLGHRVQTDRAIRVFFRNGGL